MTIVVQPDIGLKLRGASVRFDTVQALDQVDLNFPAGSVTALLGENGSGKSTVVKILAGLLAPDAGSIEIFGRTIDLPLSPRQSAGLGIRFMHQDLGLIDSASVAENIALGAGFGSAALGWISASKMRKMAERSLAAVGARIDPEVELGSLSMRDKTIVALARMLSLSSLEVGAKQVIVLDEPTASLPPEDARDIYRIAVDAARRGAVVILITHHLEDVLAVADQVIVLRGGKLSGMAKTESLSVSDLTDLILTKDAASQTRQSDVVGRKRPERGEAVLSAKGLSGLMLRQVDFTLHRGEILGLVGPRASGTGELIDMLCGMARPVSGDIVLEGKSFAAAAPYFATSAGIATVPEDRRRRGIHMQFSIADNIALSVFRQRGNGALQPLPPSQALKQAEEWISRLNIRPANGQAIAGSLSGGNQQKVALARAIALKPRILVLDEPTQGVDVGAQATIHEEIRRFVEAGRSVLILSSNHEELVHLCDRVLIFNGGRISDEIDAERLTKVSLLESSDHALNVEPTDKVFH